MASKTFAIRTEPHDAEIAGRVFLFRPEVIGAEFLGAYNTLRAAQRKHATKKDQEPTRESLEAVTAALRTFIKEFMLPEGHDAFDGLTLPDRVLLDIFRWLVEIYGSGAGDRPTG